MQKNILARHKYFIREGEYANMRILRWIDKHLEITLMVISLVAICFFMTAQVIARRFLGLSISFSEELCRHLFVWMGFLSISYSIRAGSIIRLDIVNLLLPKKVIKALTVIVDLFMGAMFAYLTFQSMTIVFTMNQRWSSLPISMNWVYAVLPVGFALSSLRSLQMCIIGAKTNIQNIEMIADEFVTAEKKNLSCDTEEV